MCARKNTGIMKKTLFWVPRVLGIVFVLFISMFALDAFDAKTPFIKALAGFLIHLIPAYLLIIMLIIAWKKEMIGGILYIAMGIAFLFMSRFEFQASIIFGPLVLIGSLFLVSHFYNKKGSQAR